MSQTSPAMGVLLFGAFWAVSVYVLVAVQDGWKALGWVTAVTAAMLAVGWLGFKRQGLNFFSQFGDWVASWGESDEGERSRTKSKARRPPGYWTSKLIVAVGDQCEFPRCRKTRYLEVHHIDPFAVSGSNRLSNLIVVCPEHHKDFGAGAMNKTRQREYIRRKNRFVDPGFPARWNSAVLSKERAAVEEDWLSV